MLGIFFYVMGLAIVRALRNLRTKGPHGLCAGCTFVHMQYGATGRNAVFCTYGRGVRLVKLDVLYCTDYRNRYQPARTVRIGFVPEVQGVETEAKRRDAA
jgi:hypothetical protein